MKSVFFRILEKIRALLILLFPLGPQIPEDR